MTQGGRMLRVALAFLPWGFYFLMLTPGPWQALLFSPSRFREWVGLPCPLCGGTRATMALLLGNWMDSLYLNPLALVVFCGTLMWTAACLFEAVLGRALVPDGERYSGQIGKWAFIAILIFWVYHAATAVLFSKEALLNRQGILFHPGGF